MIKTYNPIVCGQGDYYADMEELHNGEWVSKNDHDAVCVDHIKSMDSATETMKLMKYKIEMLQKQFLVEEDIKDELNRKLEIARKALEFYREKSPIEMDYGDYARQALKEIEKK